MLNPDFGKADLQLSPEPRVWIRQNLGDLRTETKQFTVFLGRFALLDAKCKVNMSSFIQHGIPLGGSMQEFVST